MHLNMSEPVWLRRAYITALTHSGTYKERRMGDAEKKPFFIAIDYVCDGTNLIVSQISLYLAFTLLVIRDTASK